MTYPDVPSNAWYAEYVNDLSDKGVINGYDDGTYKPSNTLTYGEFMKLIMTASAPDVKYNIVPDLPFEHWAAPYVKVALNYGVIDKGEITFKEIVEQVAVDSGRAAVVIEKDYYVFLLLRELMQRIPELVFKG